MNNLNERIAYLFELYVNNNCTDSERQELTELLCLPENEEMFKHIIAQKVEISTNASEIKSHILSASRSEEIYQEIISHKNETEEASVVKLNRYNNRKWIWMAAAVIVLLLGVSLYMRLSQNSSKSQDIKANYTLTKDINPPSSTKAVIILADGRKITLDSVESGAVAKQGNTSLVKLNDGQIVYNGKSTGELQYNTLNVPRGGKVVTVTLSDGTKVWLNSESSLKYPVNFAVGERVVEIRGEAYFEVTHNATAPFKVLNGDMSVTVLGTHFNVNTYRDDNETKVSLLEGSVKVNKGPNTSMLKPGQQARITSVVSVENNVNMDEVVAWKEGKFQFGEANSISAIMKEISRWYDVEIVYSGKVDGRVGGTISRNLPVSQVLKMLAMTGVFEFQISGKKVIVKQK